MNQHGLVVLTSPTSGRGVYATRRLAAGLTVEISPVLVFPGEEYDAHGRHTQLDSYTFVWSKRAGGQSDMALALGMGSLFNHCAQPNVSWRRQAEQGTIAFTTARAIEAGEELCISYGVGRMWWEPPGQRCATPPPTEDSEMAALAGLGGDETDACPSSPGGGRAAGADCALDWDALGLWRLTAAEDPATMAVPVARAWIATVPAQMNGVVTAYTRTTGNALGARSRQEGWEASRHLKMVRASRERGHLDVVLCLDRAGAGRDEVQASLAAHAPWYTDACRLRSVPVPAGAAPSRTRLAEWSALWPTSVRAGAGRWVDRRAEHALWAEPRRAEWVRDGFRGALAAARRAGEEGQVAVGAVVCPVFEDDGRRQREGGGLRIAAHDTRVRERHPLRHAVLNAVRKVADAHAATEGQPHGATAGGCQQGRAGSGGLANGSDYLLTNLALFTTHEPCTFCTMALVHSRVKQVFFMRPSPHSGGLSGAAEPEGEQPRGGGLGGPYAIHEKASLNHHFEVFQAVMAVARGAQDADVDVDEDASVAGGQAWMAARTAALLRATAQLDGLDA